MFTFNDVTNYDIHIVHRLGLSEDSPFLSADDVAANDLLKAEIEFEVNQIATTYDDLVTEYEAFPDPNTDEAQAVFYKINNIKNGAMLVYAGRLATDVMPTVIPKYMSDNRSVFDRFRTTDFVALGQKLRSTGLAMIADAVGVDLVDYPITQRIPPSVNVITGE